MIDIEQLVIADPAHFTYPIWPPRFMVDLIHWWGRTYDPPLMAREPWWRATIWIDQLVFGPFYVSRDVVPQITREAHWFKAIYIFPGCLAFFMFFGRACDRFGTYSLTWPALCLSRKRM